MLTSLLTSALLAAHPGHTPDRVSLDDLRDAAEAAHSSTLAVARDGHTVGLWHFDGPRRPINV